MVKKKKEKEATEVYDREGTEVMVKNDHIAQLSNSIAWAKLIQCVEKTFQISLRLKMSRFVNRIKDSVEAKSYSEVRDSEIKKYTRKDDKGELIFKKQLDNNGNEVNAHDFIDEAKITQILNKLGEESSGLKVKRFRVTLSEIKGADSSMADFSVLENLLEIEDDS